MVNFCVVSTGKEIKQKLRGNYAKIIFRFKPSFTHYITSSLILTKNKFYVINKLITKEEEMKKIMGLFPGCGVPPALRFVPPDPSSIEEGGVALEGQFGLALAGVFCEHDTEFILRDDGVAVWDNTAFRGLQGRVRLIKKEGQLIFEILEATEKTETK